ncbi:hypothetical protein [Nostoc sp. UHCC 0252]|uniref:hypothetical protein n=1 Tax=Nostoc sp. UHCC 0252 TaxID=3110241 RepID=UPI002B21AF89|nr:hypothetical protein [Nostoc sp. UHCC 0252]MEA5600153.1 hypothetical protein [Nostoc sp. UHCC 0252]
MEINQSNSEVKFSALKTTLLIIIYSLPSLVCLSLPVIIFRDKFVGFWLKAPSYYPFSFSMALFVTLSCGAATLWTLRQKQKDINISFVILSIFCGCSLNILLYILYIPFPINILMSFVLFLISLIQTPILTTLALIAGIFYSFLIPTPLICIYFSCLYSQNVQDKPSSIRKRIIYIIPLLAILITPYIIAATIKLTPGLILPIEFRNIVGLNQFGFSYKNVIEKMQQCQQLEDYIGAKKVYALAEGRNYQTFVFTGNSAGFVLEVVGEKGTAFVNACSGDCGEVKTLPVRIYTKSRTIDLTYERICG